jgi:hypothetical protein
MHRSKKLLAAISAALAVASGTLALTLATPARAATSLSVTLSAAGTNASAVWNSAGDPVLSVGTPSTTTYARMQVNNPPATAPAAAPTLASDNYHSGSPRWYIQFANGDYLFGFPSGAGLGTSNWQVIPAASGPCHTLTHTPQFDTYLNSLAFIQSGGCDGNVTGAGIIADGGQASGTSDTITHISYDGETLAAGSDVVTVTSPGSQSSTVGAAIGKLTIKASSNKGDGIASYAASGLPTGLSIDTSTGAITGTPTAVGNYAVTITVTDNGGTKGSATFAWLISNGGGPTATYTGALRLYKMGLCLDDRFNSSTPGNAPVQVWRCNGLANQKWQVMSDGTIRHNGLCLDAVGAGTANRTKVQLWSCTGGANQKWDTRGWRIHYDNPHAVNEVLDDPAFRGSGTQQEIFSNNGGANQLWATS